MGKIEFRTVEVEETIRTLAEFFSMLRGDPAITKKKREKFSRWAGDLQNILAQISSFERHAVPLITADLGYSFRDRNLLLTSMMQPGTRTIFSQIKTYSVTDPEFPISIDDLDLLIAAPDTAGSLAWVGDTAIKYAFLFSVRETGITPEKLHNGRKALETNRNLSELCDRWQLYRNRIYQDSDKPQEKKLEKIKGTLTETIFGLIFIERDIQGVQDALPLIETK